VGGYAGAGLFISTTVLMLTGAASTTIGGPSDDNPAAAFTGHLPAFLAAATLLAIALGAVAANVLNVYSGALAFLAMGVRLPLAWRRAAVALAFGAVGFVLAWLGLSDAGAAYENFLLIIAYWIGPWLGVVLVELYRRRTVDVGPLLADPRTRNWPGFFSFLTGLVVSVALFANQALYVAPIPRAVPAVGDLTFAVGFVLAAGLYLVLGRGVSSTGHRARLRGLP
jgi:purine-cytosine permease-like protein